MVPTVVLVPFTRMAVVKEDAMNTRSSNRRRTLAAVGIALAAVMPLAACAGGSGGTGS